MPDLIGHPYKPSANRPTPPRRSAPSPMPRPEKRSRPLYRKKRFLIPIGLLLVALGAFAVVTHLAKQAEERRQIVLAERARFADYLEAQEARYLKIGLLTDRQRAQLRRSTNAVHVEAAQRLGITPVAERDDVLDQADEAGLVNVNTENPYYWVDDLTHSVPYATPDAAAALDSIGVRFQQKLASFGLPPYKFFVTSVLRTQEDQERLRGVNVNAAQGTSSHEFGTTFDLQFRAYRYAGDPADELWEPAFPFLKEEFAAELTAFYARMEELYRSRLLALLGETMIELEDEGKLITVMERRQPVFHTTVARPLAEPTAAP
ncbi:MAG: DUF5715 family protein [Rhodothermales bacterium]